MGLLGKSDFLSQQNCPRMKLVVVSSLSLDKIRKTEGLDQKPLKIPLTVIFSDSTVKQ